jgi:hypothetical protein
MSNVATLKTGNRPMGIVPETFEDVQRLATMAVASGLWKADRRDTDQQKHAKATMAIMQGLECGVPPMQAVQSIAVINGKCVMYGDLLTALLWANGFDIEQTITGVGDARTATCTITRPNGKKITRSFSVLDAKKARLHDARPTVKKQWDGKWEEKPNDSPWFKYEDRMLGWRALGNCQKDGASDVTKGLHIREDIEAELPMRDITPTKAVALDLPDIPDAEPEPVDEPLADPAGYLAKLQDDRALCESEVELKELIEANVDMLARLSPTDRVKADAILAME